MTTALYRRYRPESFGEMIGQSQVTDPLMTALRGDRVGHAYLFSGPRGCGKTTSARILARCLNCAEGPTDVPCGTCPSCVELSRAGGGSLDVVEIDAASHNGVDDARDLRERATFAPSRDRYKIFILDEAHMVTPQGFNALLKLVEEPPEHVKFIFATTEPEKVLGTIRSRTHHYPFRLVPPAAMLEYVEKLCVEEGVVAERGVLPLVVRAGGGSPRDTLSLLDQLIAGSDSPAGSETVTVAYERAVALLGYTHAALLDEIVDALAAGDAAAAFPAIDRVVQTGQDPRRFVDDLLERLRDLIVIAAVGAGASSVLRGLAEDDLARMRTQADSFGAARLSRTADVVSAALDDMSGATSPRLHLELMVARVLAARTDADADGVAAPATSPRADAAPATVASRTGAPAVAAPTETARSAQEPSSPPASTQVPETSVHVASDESVGSTVHAAPDESIGSDSPGLVAADVAEAAEIAAEVTEPETPAPAEPSGPVTFGRITESWPGVLKRLEGLSRTSWLLATAVQPLAYDTESEVLTLGFASQHDVARFKGTTPGAGPSDHLRMAIEHEVGVKVKYRPAPMPAGGAPRQPSSPSSGAPAADASASEPASARSPRPQTSSASAAAVTEWAVARIPASIDPVAMPAPVGARASESAPPAVPSTPAAPTAASPAVVAEPSSADAGAAAPAAAPEVSSERDDAPYPPDDEPPYYDDEPPYDPAYEPTPVRGSSAQAAPARSQSPSPSAPTGPVRAPAPGRSASSATPTPTTHAAPAAPTVTERTPSGGVQRYGEAVIRQVLGATFVREEPYEPPTRFS